VTKHKDLNAAIDNLLKTYKTPEEIVGENGIRITGAIFKRRSA